MQKPWFKRIFLYMWMCLWVCKFSEWATKMPHIVLFMQRLFPYNQPFVNMQMQDQSWEVCSQCQRSKTIGWTTEKTGLFLTLLWAFHSLQLMLCKHQWTVKFCQIQGLGAGLLSYICLAWLHVKSLTEDFAQQKCACMYTILCWPHYDPSFPQAMVFIFFKLCKNRTL